MDKLTMMLVGHLVGDFLLQNDWMALHKTRSTWHCLVHVTIYTLAVSLLADDCSWLFLAAVFLPHFVIDRFRLPRYYMSLVGQEQFATGACAPWSLIVVDQVWHFACLYATARWICPKVL